MPLVEQNAGGGDPRVLAQVLAEYKEESTSTKGSSTKPKRSTAKKVKTVRSTSGIRAASVGSHSPRRDSNDLRRLLNSSGNANGIFASWSWSHGHLVVTPARAGSSGLRSPGGRMGSGNAAGVKHEVASLLKAVSRGSTKTATASEKVEAGGAVLTLLGIASEDPVAAIGGAVVAEGAGDVATGAHILAFATHPTKKNAEAVLNALGQDLTLGEVERHGGGKTTSSFLKLAIDAMFAEGLTSIQGGSKKK